VGNDGGGHVLPLCCLREFVVLGVVGLVVENEGHDGVMGWMG
jgi:hypothetical protein